MSKRLPPNWTSKAAPPPGTASESPVEGVDNLPLPAGTNRWAVRLAEAASEAIGMDAMGIKGNEANGDNPKIADSIDFATGKDVREYAGGPSGSADAPGKVGAP